MRRRRAESIGADAEAPASRRVHVARASEILYQSNPVPAHDPRGTEAVEELIWELRGQYTILIVTHNMSQARRASEECIFMLMGKVIEHGETTQIFVAPTQEETADYIRGRYG